MIFPIFLWDTLGLRRARFFIDDKDPTPFHLLLPLSRSPLPQGGLSLEEILTHYWYSCTSEVTDSLDGPFHSTESDTCTGRNTLGLGCTQVRPQFTLIPTRYLSYRSTSLTSDYQERTICLFCKPRPGVSGDSTIVTRNRGHDLCFSTFLLVLDLPFTEGRRLPGMSQGDRGRGLFRIVTRSTVFSWQVSQVEVIMFRPVASYINLESLLFNSWQYPLSPSVPSLVSQLTPSPIFPFSTIRKTSLSSYVPDLGTPR